MNARRWWTMLALAAVTLASVGVVMAVVAVREQARTDARGFASQIAAEDAPLLLETPPFTLTDTSGQPFGSADLAGKVYVVDFMFTRCTLACPIMTAQMKRLADHLETHPRRDEVALVSVSVDPEHDTPAVLAEYAAKFDADTTFWHFLTGDSREQVWRLVEGGFKLPLDEAPENVAMPIQHSTRFALVTRDGKIWGYYDAYDREEQERLVVEIDRALARD